MATVSHGNPTWYRHAHGTERGVVGGWSSWALIIRRDQSSLFSRHAPLIRNQISRRWAVPIFSLPNFPANRYRFGIGFLYAKFTVGLYVGKEPKGQNKQQLNNGQKKSNYNWCADCSVHHLRQGVESRVETRYSSRRSIHCGASRPVKVTNCASHHGPQEGAGDRIQPTMKTENPEQRNRPSCGSCGRCAAGGSWA